MKIALVQTSPLVADLEGNVARLLEAFDKAAAMGAELAVAPEMSLTAYPPRDLLDRPDFVDAQRRALDELASKCALPALVGVIDPRTVGDQRRLFNSAALIENGVVRDVIDKSLLPTYDVFDERRYFTPSTGRRVVELGGVKLGVSICEDAWNDPTFWTDRHYDEDPVAELAELGAELFINLSASPFGLGKRELRLKMFRAQAQRHGRPLVIVNQVGAHDDLIFDGGSMAFEASGELAAKCKEFDEDLMLIDVDLASGRIQGESRECSGFDREGENGAALDALTLGLRHYVHKCGFRSVVLGLSGGIDSALTAAIAARAIGAENVYGVALPSRYSSDHSLTDAEALAQALGVNYQVIPIVETVAALESTLAPSFAGKEEDVTEENIQARARGIILMALSNKFGHLLLNTGNKSEVAVGYCTLYGDMCGGLSILSDVFKTRVYELSREINRQAGRDIIPESTLVKPPSAELRPGQVDQDSLPDYPILDELLQRYLENFEPMSSLVEDFDPALVRRVLRMVRLNEYKRYQLAPGLKITSKAFGPGRRHPLACKFWT